MKREKLRRRPERRILRKDLTCDPDKMSFHENPWSNSGAKSKGWLLDSVCGTIEGEVPEHVAERLHIENG
jgi:hypothetical protein